MKLQFKKLTEEQKETFKNIYKDKSVAWDDRMRALMDFTGKSERTVRKWAIKLGLKEREEVESPEFEKAKQRTFDEGKKRFIITWAQNNTPVHQRFLINLKSYAKFIDADIHVIAGRYKNPTSVFTDKDFDRWHSPVLPYLDAARHSIHKYVSIMSDIKIQPTAVNPMSGLQGVSGINSCIFGHPKVQFEMIPVLEGYRPKQMLTTGACTRLNYTDSKAGKKGEFHHTIGFVVVEIKDDDTFFARQVTAEDNGDFTDLFYNVKFEGKKVPVDFGKYEYPEVQKVLWKKDNFWEKESTVEPYTWQGKGKIKKVKNFEAIILGDLHYGNHDEAVLAKTHELMQAVKPKHVVLHDVFDGYSISHHDLKDPFQQYYKEVDGRNSLQAEIDDMIEGLEPFTDYENVVVVRSNHDDFVDRWLKNTDWRKTPTPKNSLNYMEYSTILLKREAENGIIPYIINENYPEFITLGLNDSMVLYSI
jgi:hypothetical protein